MKEWALCAKSLSVSIPKESLSKIRCQAETSSTRDLSLEVEPRRSRKGFGKPGRVCLLNDKHAEIERSLGMAG